MTYITNALETYQFMREKNIIIAFTGHIDHHITTSLLKNIKNKLELLQVNSGINKKIYSVLVESVENVSKHSSPDHRAMMLVGKSENSYTIITGNHVPNKNIPRLKEKLEQIGKLDPAGLKNSYREQLLSKRTHENRAGLGIIDIAIKSDNNIKYDFHPLTEDASFYLLQVEILINK